MPAQAAMGPIRSVARRSMRDHVSGVTTSGSTSPAPRGWHRSCVGHFDAVFRVLLKPACLAAGFHAVHPKDVKKESDLIHETILRRLLDAPMVVCDLSTRNPNVLFELGLRQAFDKPVVLVQEAGTPRIFDIAPLRALDYTRDLRWESVEKEKPEIASFVKNTYQAHKGKGWGVIAKELGIKPGSREFHALKNGDLVYGGGPSEGGSKGKGKGKGHNK